MRCAVVRSPGKGIENLVLEEREAPRAGGEEVRVRVSATALNRADLLQRRGLYPAPPGAPADIPGLEFTGRIDQVGERVTAWKGGERVFGIVPGGSYAEYVVTHERLAVAVPDALDDAQAAAVPEAFLSAHDALVTRGEMRSGDRVLVHAVTSGVGSAAVQIVHLWGARAVGTGGSREKMDRVAALAPFLAVNYREEDFQARIEEAYGPEAIDLVLDLVGAAYWQRSLAVLRKGGRLVLFGVLGGAAANTRLALILFKRLKIVGTARRARPREEKIRATQAFAAEVVPHLGTGRLAPVVDSVFPFERLHEATARMEKNENTGKIVLRFGE